MKNKKLTSIISILLSLTLLISACANTAEETENSTSIESSSTTSTVDLTTVAESTSTTSSTSETTSTSEEETSSQTTQKASTKGATTTTSTTVADTSSSTTTQTSSSTTSTTTTTRATTTAAPTTTTIPTTTEAVNLKVSLTIDLTSLADNPELLGEPLHSTLVPESGYITANTTIDIGAGDNPIDILQRFLDAYQIPYDIRSGAYVAAINNIYEFMAGGESGWAYSVNGIYPEYGARDYVLQDGDVVVWEYLTEKAF